MSFQRRLNPRHSREDGAVLPMALGFLILFSILIGLIFNFVNAGISSSTALEGQRNDLYSVSGAVDAAINRVRNDPSLGKSDSTAPCTLNGVPLNGETVAVACVAESGSGEPIPTTAAPPFAILTMSPFITLSPSSWSGNTPPNCVNVPTPEPPNELGVVQVQDSKLVTVTGNVYVNSDADSDVWSGGCPQTTTAQHILVNGDVKQRSSCHDIDPILDSYDWLCGNGSATPQTPANPDGPLGGAADADLNDPAIAQPNSWALPFTNAPPVQTVPSCPAGNVVAFEPGTYNDAAALSTLMDGVTCPDRIFWFKPGQYYFNFTNAGSHEWSINDGQAKVIAGQPTAVTIGGTLVGPTRWAATTATGTSGFSTPSNAIDIGGPTSDVQLGNITATTGPTTWNAGGASSTTFAPAANAVSIDGSVASAALQPATTVTLAPSSPPVPTTSSPGFSNLTNALALGDNNTANSGSFNTQNQIRSIFLGGYTTGQVPAGATNIQVQARVRHQDSTTGGSISNLQVLVRDAADTSTFCTLNVDKSTSMVTALAPSSGPVACGSITQNDLNTGNYRLRYQVQHSGSGSTNVSSNLDGLELVVTYTLGGNSSASTSLMGYSGGGAIPGGATINTITMSVAHNEGTTSSATVNAPTVTLPGCTQTLTRRASLTTDTVTLGSGCLSVAQLNAGPSLTYTVSEASGSSSPVNADLDGITLAVTYTVTSSGSSGTQSVTLSGYATNPLTTIPDDATITSVRLRVAHGEDNPNLVNSPTVTITPANSPACTAVTINKHAGVSEDVAPSYDVTSCFSLPAQINNGVSLTYRISHCSRHRWRVHDDGHDRAPRRYLARRQLRLEPTAAVGPERPERQPERAGCLPARRRPVLDRRCAVGLRRRQPHQPAERPGRALRQAEPPPRGSEPRPTGDRPLRGEARRHRYVAGMGCRLGVAPSDEPLPDQHLGGEPDHVLPVVERSRDRWTHGQRALLRHRTEDADDHASRWMDGARHPAGRDRHLGDGSRHAPRDQQRARSRGEQWLGWIGASVRERDRVSARRPRPLPR